MTPPVGPHSDEYELSSRLSERTHMGYYLMYALEWILQKLGLKMMGDS